MARSLACMGTTVSVQLAAPPTRIHDAEVSVSAALTWLEEVDARLSRFRPESELSTLNRNAGRWFAASSLLFAAVERAVRAAEESCGLFDPTLLPQIEALGYDRDFAQIAHRETARATRLGDGHHSPCSASWHDIVVDTRRQRIRLPAGVRLDLGGIAKGWAADVVLDRFCAGYPGALVNVGGDLRVHGGPRPGTGWTIALRDPRGKLSTAVDATEEAHASIDEPALASITLSRGGLATSGAVRRWWLRDGHVAHHLIDPRTGAPAPLWTTHPSQAGPEHAQRIASVTALAPTAAQAEVATKMALLTGYPGALSSTLYTGIAGEGQVGQFVPAHAVAIFVVLGDGSTYLCDDFATYLQTWATEGAHVPYSIAPHTTPPHTTSPIHHTQ